MPIHDWTRVPSGLYHHFHQQWAGELCNALNAGPLPAGYFALVDQRAVGLVPDVLALRRGARSTPTADNNGGVALAVEARPKARFIAEETDRQVYARRANHVAIRNDLGELVAVIELVSPGNKDSRHALEKFVAKAIEFLDRGVNLLLVDLFPPTSRDPQGIHKVVWDEVQEEPFALPADKRLTVVAYEAAPGKRAYVEPVAVGDVLPSLPIFLDSSKYVPAPLEASYQATWNKCPAVFREAVESGKPSNDSGE